ncbi:MFS transporter [uncultured Bifidobacterium sp.]|uniref:MFS transporter n=1 Tax=uncultured Bifidobacterium sp. TaxID=165187 RepID=UPI0028DC5D36|nr:MFS transporter [uncultured Bifidobacterium sp.]
MTSADMPSTSSLPVSVSSTPSSSASATASASASASSAPTTAPAPRYVASPYRWVVLAATIPLFAITQMYWLTFSTISPQAAAFYHTTPLAIATLSMSYMVAYILFSMPASLLCDRRGIRACFAVAAALTAVFGMLRGVLYASFPLVVVCQLGLAVAQPFVMNPLTKLAANWFPVDQRATVTGIGSVAGYVGIAVAAALTPTMYESMGMGGMLRAMGWVAIVSALLVMLLVREEPATPAGPRAEQGRFRLRDALALRHNRDYVLLLVSVMIALGVFNALLTAIADMFVSRGITTDQSGMVGTAIILAGIVGGVVLPLASDRTGRRHVFIVVAMLLAIVALAGLSYLSSYPALIACGGVAGLFIMGVGPLVFEYGTEVAYPVPEATSYGLLMLSGQVSGIVFILLMYGLQLPDKSMVIPLSVMMALMVVAAACSAKVRESALVRGNAGADEN